jgi:hypothetical protein
MELASGFSIRGGPVFADFSVCGDFEDEMALAGGLKLNTGMCGSKRRVSSMLTPSPCIDFFIRGDFEDEMELAEGLGLYNDNGEGNSRSNR